MVYERSRHDPLERVRRTCRRRRTNGNNANASTENSISANTARLSCRREASTTAAETAALIESTDVSLSCPHQRQTRTTEDACVPLALDWRGAVGIVCERGVDQEERGRERPDRVGGCRGCQGTEDRRECYEREEDEQGRFDCARTCNTAPIY